MKVCRVIWAAAGLAAIGLLSRHALAAGQKTGAVEADDGTEHTIVLGVGGATEVELTGGPVRPGANIMVEWDAIENWLELEVGASLLSANSGIEAPIDLLVKKPFRLAQWAEFMIGVGPEMVVVSNPTTKTRYFGGQAALDFMFWPRGRHVGLWLEPEVDLTFPSGRASSSIGSTGGVLLGW